MLVTVALLIVGILLAPVLLRALRVARAEAELRPTLERARSVMAGTADPPASEGLDGAMYEESFDFPQGEYYPDATRAEVTPIVVVDAEYGGDEVVLTVGFFDAYYRADGSEVCSASHSHDRWYLRREDGRWVFYRVETRLEG